MIRKLESVHEHVLAIDIVNEYVYEDAEQCKKWFEEKLNQGYQVINFLVKVDQLSLTHISCRAFWDDGMYSFRHMKNLGHLAIVGHSKLEKIAVTLDGMVFDRSKKGRIERYFDIGEMDKAWEFVNEKVPVQD